jgi:hypothetical protein
MDRISRRCSMLAALATAALLAWPLAAAQPARTRLPNLAGRVLQVGCRQGECVWLRVTRVGRVAANRHGELRRIVGRGGLSLYPNGIPPRGYSRAIRVRWNARDHGEFAFCSIERPAHAFPDERGRLILHYLDLFNVAGYQLSSATTYMRLCHSRAFNEEDRAVLRRLGYRPGTRHDQVEDASPEDLARF